MPVLVPTHPQASAPATVIVVASDDFGRHVAQALTALVPDVVLLPADEADDLTACPAGQPGEQPTAMGSAAVVLASLRPEPRLRERLGAWTYATQRPFLPLEVDQAHLAVGPWVVAGESACDWCYRRRLRQHDPAGAVTHALRSAYAADPTLRPRGWLPATASVAAAVVALTLQGEAGGLVPGAVRTINTINLIPSFGAVTGFTGCRICDDSDLATRSWSELSVAVRLLVTARR